jgi:hypothetical protein
MSQIAMVAVVGPNFSRYYTDKGTTAAGGRITWIAYNGNGDIEVHGIPDNQESHKQHFEGKIEPKLLVFIPKEIALVEHYPDLGDPKEPVKD